MKIIEREFYLHRIINLIGIPDIKVITGVRRSGKSELLNSLERHIKENIADANIIHIDFNLLDFEDLKTYRQLYDYVKSLYVSDKHNFVLIDEVQMCDGFEKTINSLHTSGKYDIFITGSNAFLLSSDLATLFTGRTYEIKVFPFSFSEYMQYFEYEDKYAALDKYILEGGMSGSYPYVEQEEKFNYIAEVFDTLIVRDIQQRYRIRNLGLMNKVVDYLMDNISNLSSTRGITNTLTSTNEKVNHVTISNYIQYLCNAFAFYRVRRYDIRGKKYLSSNDKYYLSDHTFRYAKLGTRNIDYGRVLENIVAIELLRRGYEVYVGVLYGKEIDFVALKRSEKLYIQVSDNISDEKTFEREVTPLLQIKDAYPKIILARTRYDEYQYEGVRIIDIADWLIGKN